MKLLLLYRRRWGLFYLPVLLLALAVVWWSATVWKTLPPAKAVIAGGSPQGSYAQLAQRYAEQLERLGLAVEIVYSDRQKGSLERLLTRGDVADIGFAHGLYASTGVPVQALAVVGQEPVWIFTNLPGLTSLSQAKGLKVAAGASNTSSFSAAKALLAHAGLRDTDVQFSSASGLDAANALLDGKIDILFEAAGDNAQAIQLLHQKNTVHLLGVERAGALAAQDPRLQSILLPQGAIELRGDVPTRDLILMGLQTHLLVRPDMHPALQRALLDAALEIHQFPSFLQRHGQFPSFRGSDFPLSPEARAYSLGSRPWLELLLPYGLAQGAELILYALLPVLALTFLVLAWIPRLFDWRISAAMQNFYGELKFLETEMESTASNNPIALRRLLAKLDHIEKQVTQLDLPAEYSERWYTLREHLAAAREKLLKLRAR
ncbi:TAXI family TRAP transporter solute-binding subunit [Polaromonas sp. SM01]|uniref:TAXI family TRAP transporter solute-binding subunit n=1 Tax=Polaromonas sp. SM01 TaxID=3085630 RepID=UPI002981B9E3|nr:TAXI family TRAP transporter solute-binding subunit [Polaromonas sp. SM01]MDW5444489.1 TAXI family TRAP transporter solute-binding subunit [Polaromonas sp. SM01]